MNESTCIIFFCCVSGGLILDVLANFGKMMVDKGREGYIGIGS